MRLLEISDDRAEFVAISPEVEPHVEEKGTR